MTSFPLTLARNRLSELVEEVSSTHDRVAITRHGHIDAILISPDDLASLEETLTILSTPGLAERIQSGLAEAAAGQVVSAEEFLGEFGAK